MSFLVLAAATAGCGGEVPQRGDRSTNTADSLVSPPDAPPLGGSDGGGGGTSDGGGGGGSGDSAAGSPDAGATQGAGTFASPIVIPSLPYTHSADTRNAPASAANSYSPCAPGTNEGGGEFVYKLTLSQPTRVVVAVDDKPGDGIDVDVHILGSPSPSDCLARHNVSVTRDLAAGTYYIVVDTWVDSSNSPKPGPYTLTVRVDGGGGGGTGNCLKSPIPSCQDKVYPTANGVPTEAPGSGGCPAGMVRVDSFCIDRYEAMLVLETSSGLMPFSPFQNPGTQPVRALSVAGVVPQGYINQQQAAAACARAGKRLCSDTEWLRACQGAAKTTYPYGNTRQTGVCNDARTCHPVVQFFESAAQSVWSKLGHPCINQMPGGLAKTGANAGCKTAEGVMDMMGNLHEWTATASGIFRGGFYVDTVRNGNGCLYRTTAHNTLHWDYSTGFRCCADL